MLSSGSLANKNRTEGWWKEDVFYQIFMPSYADSDGNGYGDFKGMTTRLDYLSQIEKGNRFWRN